MKITLERIAAVILCAVGAFFACLFAVRYLLPIAAPFALAYLSALATKGVAEKWHRKTGIPASFLRVFLLVAFILALFAAFFLLCVCLAREAEDLLLRFGGGYGNAFSSVGARLRAFLSRFDRDGILGAALDSLLREGTTFVFSLLSGTLKGLLAFFPRAVVFLFVTIVAALYFALDLHRVHASVAELCPPSLRNRAFRVAATLKRFLLRYLRAYTLLSALIFPLLLCGFLLIGVRYAVLLAALLTLLDLLPVLGVGCALVPWALFELAGGNGFRGFALLLLFAVVFTVRAIAEPRIVGAQMGLHPLLSLFLTYAGFRLFGIAGMICAPVLAGIACSLLREKREGKEILRE